MPPERDLRFRHSPRRGPRARGRMSPAVNCSRGTCTASAWFFPRRNGRAFQHRGGQDALSAHRSHEGDHLRLGAVPGSKRVTDSASSHNSILPPAFATTARRSDVMIRKLAHGHQVQHLRMLRHQNRRGGAQGRKREEPEHAAGIDHTRRRIRRRRAERTARPAR